MNDFYGNFEANCVRLDKREQYQFNFDTIKREVLFPAIIGMACAILLFMFVPAAVNLYLEGVILENYIMQFAFAEVTDRLTTVLRGDFSKESNWGVPLFGSLMGYFICFFMRME